MQMQKKPSWREPTQVKSKKSVINPKHQRRELCSLTLEPTLAIADLLDAMVVDAGVHAVDAVDAAVDVAVVDRETEAEDVGVAEKVDVVAVDRVAVVAAVVASVVRDVVTVVAVVVAMPT